MKDKLQFNSYKLLLTLLLVLSNIMLYAQPPAGPPPTGSGATGGTPPCWNPECVPIDSGIAFLLIAGLALGITKLYSKYKTA